MALQEVVSLFTVGGGIYLYILLPARERVESLPAKECYVVIVA